MNPAERQAAIKKLRDMAWENVRMARETINMCEQTSRQCHGGQVSAETQARVREVRRSTLTMLANTKAHCRRLAGESA